MKQEYKTANISPVFWTFITLLPLNWAGCASNVETGEGRPNVIIVLTDDQGYGDIAAHGNPILKTPNLDKLYNQSVHFTQFHVAPMCTPSRGELLTGKDAFRNGAVFVTEGKSHIHRGIPSIADVFSSNGYATGHFGKWHLGDNYPYRPQDRGFQETVYHGAWGVTSMVDYWSNDYTDDTYSHNGEYEKYSGYCTDVWFSEAMKWMKHQSNNNKPFLAYLPTNVPHVPRIIKGSYMQLYEEKISDINTQAFFGMITHLDENLGILEQFLSDNDLRENTIFIFMTDNGTDGGNKIYNAGMRGKKGSYYDGGHRVPFYIRWPAKNIEEPRDINNLTHSTDLFPTLIEMCGLKKNKNLQFDGMDISGLIFDQGSKLSDRMKVISYRELNRGQSAVLWNKWRLVNYIELFDIEQDPNQQLNIAEEHPEIVNTMQAHYNNWYDEMYGIDKEVDLISIGSDKELETFLCSANWTGDYADSWRNIYVEPNLTGYWSVQVESTGLYDISLYRWPKQSGLSLTDDFYNINIQHQSSYNKSSPTDSLKLAALPVSAARLKVDDQVYEKNADVNSAYVSFEVNLQKGQIVNLEPFLLGQSGEVLCGAYFTYVSRIK